MIRLVARRLLLAIPLLLLVTFTVFGLVSLAPGDPAYVLAGDNPTPERVAEIRKELHLDDSLAARYGHWVSRAVHGDLGTSLVNRNTTVGTILKNKIPTTLSIAALGIVISTVVALLLAIASARKHGGIIDRASIRATGSCGRRRLTPELLRVRRGGWILFRRRACVPSAVETPSLVE